MSVGKIEDLCEWWSHFFHGFVPECNNKQLRSG